MKQKKNRYMIGLEETRSKIALIAGILVFSLTILSIIMMVDTYSRTSEHPLHYFTVLSNFMSAVGAAFMIPYAAEGIHKKRFVLPRWIVQFQYAGATCVAITMVTALLIIWPTQGNNAVTGGNFWLHIVTPFLTVVLFQCVETGISFTRRDNIIAMIPYWIYMTVYYIMVRIIGKANGGWSDFYMTMAFIPAWASIILMLILGYAVSRALRYIQNKRAKQYWKEISALWKDDLDDMEVLIEVFGLGRSIGRKCSGTELDVPLDIFRLISKRYNIPLEKLINAYTKGALDSFEEAQNRIKNRKKDTKAKQIANQSDRSETAQPESLPGSETEQNEKS